jgi:hypothetical protein
MKMTSTQTTTKSLKFGLDYDETYTADPVLWDDWIKKAIERGHEVYLVTFRDYFKDFVDDFEHLDALNVGVICTQGIAKAFFCEQFGPGKIDIWIDDHPRRVYENSAMTVEALAEWRAANAAQNT